VENVVWMVWKEPSPTRESAEGGFDENVGCSIAAHYAGQHDSQLTAPHHLAALILQRTGDLKHLLADGLVNINPP